MGLKTITKIFAMSLLLASCTEEVAEELKNNASSNPLGGGSGVLTSSSIRLVHKMDDSMSFQLHASGSQTNPCEISPPTNDGFDPQDYFKDPSLSPDGPQVIDCILEAQENDLFQQGAKFELQVDAQLCEYVSYTPFKYVENQFGNTAKVVYQVNCTDEESVCNTGGYCNNLYDNHDSTSGVADAASFTNTVGGDALSCRFDYSDEDYGQNCDEGSVTVVTFNIDNTGVDTDADGVVDLCPSTPNNYTYSYETTDVTDCGGDHYNCIGGPSVDHFGDPMTSTEIYSNTELEEFSQEFTIEAPIERQNENPLSRVSNMYLANFSRICSSTSAGTKDYTTGTAWSGMALNGYEWESIRFDGSSTGVISAATITDAGGEDDAYAFAENPWRSTIYTTPYYSFKCLDQARDIKAQIRLFIRDWDRNFTGNPASFSLVSDADSATPLMDDPVGTQDGDPWNDLWDWDDFFGDQVVWEQNSCTDTDPASAFNSSQFPGKL